MEFLNSFCVNWIIVLLVFIVGYLSRLIPLVVIKTNRLQIVILTIVFTITYTIIFKVPIVVAITSYLLAFGFHSSLIKLIERYVFKIK